MNEIRILFAGSRDCTYNIIMNSVNVLAIFNNSLRVYDKLSFILYYTNYTSLFIPSNVSV